MEYSFKYSFTATQRNELTEWVREKLTEMTGDCDDVFLEYVMVMVANGKMMGQISEELVAFVGEPSSTEFARRYNIFPKVLKP